jgi:excisionase family DNA binding protein
MNPSRLPTSTRTAASTEPQHTRHAAETPSTPLCSDPATPPRLHTPAAAAQLLSVPESWLRRKAGQRVIPCTFLGKHLRFSDADLTAIIENGAQTDRTPRHRTTQHARRR